MCDVVGTYEIYFFLIRYSRKTALSRRKRACFHLPAARGVGCMVMSIRITVYDPTRSIYNSPNVTVS